MSLNLTLFAYDVLLQQHDLSKAAQSSIFFETLRMSGWEKLYSALENEVLCWFLKKKNPPLILLNRTKEAKSRAVIVGFKSGERTASWQLCVMQKKKKKKDGRWTLTFFLLLLLLRGWSYTNHHPELVCFNFCPLVLKKEKKKKRKRGQKSWFTESVWIV